MAADVSFKVRMLFACPVDALMNVCKQSLDRSSTQSSGAADNWWSAPTVERNDPSTWKVCASKCGMLCTGVFELENCCNAYREGKEHGKKCDQKKVGEATRDRAQQPSENRSTLLKQPEWYLLAPAPGSGITMHNGTLVVPKQGRDEEQRPF